MNDAFVAAAYSVYLTYVAAQNYDACRSFKVNHAVRLSCRLPFPAPYRVDTGGLVDNQCRHEQRHMYYCTSLGFMTLTLCSPPQICQVLKVRSQQDSDVVTDNDCAAELAGANWFNVLMTRQV